MKNKTLKSILVLTLCVIISFTTISPIIVSANDEQSNELTLQGLNMYVDNEINGKTENYLDEILSFLPLFQDIVKADSSTDIFVGDAINIYNLDTNEKVFYYPIFLNNQCVLMACQTESSGISVSTDVRPYENLVMNIVNDTTYLPYILNSQLYLENESEKILIVDYSNVYGNDINQDNSYENLSFNEKIEFIENVFSCNLSKFNYTHEPVALNTESSLNSSNKLTASYILPSGYGVNSVKNFPSAAVIQEWGDCWASSVASIVNFHLGTRYTGEDVCDVLKKDYNEGGDYNDVHRALSHYFNIFVYKINLGKISFSSVKTCIDANNPFVLMLYNSSLTGGHAVVGVGYDFSPTISHVAIYDPNGYYAAINYASPTYTVNGFSLTWTDTVYR